MNNGVSKKECNLQYTSVSKVAAKIVELYNSVYITNTKGVYNSKPPKPKNTHTWDVSCVLNPLGENKDFSLKQPTLKLAANAHVLDES